MSDFLPLYYYLMNGLFIGFGIVTVSLLIPYRFFGKELQIHIKQLIQTITKVMPYVALLYFIITFGFTIQSISDGTLNKTDDAYMDAYTIKVFVIPLMICLLWIKQIAKRLWMVGSLATLVGFFFIVMNERFIIFLTTLHRDFLPPTTNAFEYETFYFFGRFLLEQIIIFCVVIITFHFFRIKRKKVVDN